MNTNNQIIKVKIEDIVPNRFQPRINFDKEALNELAASIKRYGIIQPLTLRQIGPKYEIIAGERRYKAAIIAGLTEVPAMIATMDDQTSAELAIIENLQREELSAIEEAKSYKRLIDFSNITQAELANRLGKSQSAIANKLRLLNLTKEVQEALAKNQISERHARSLLAVKEPNQQVDILNRIIKERLTVKDTDQVIKDLTNNDSNINKDNNIEKQIPVIDKSKINIEFNQPEPQPEELPSITKFENPDIINLNDLNSDNIFQRYLNQSTKKEERKEEKNMNNELNNQIPSFDSLLQPEAPKTEPVAAPTTPQVQIPAPTPAGNKFFPDLEDESLNMGNVSANPMPTSDPSSLNSFLNSATLTPVTPVTPASAPEPEPQAPTPVVPPIESVNTMPSIEPISPIAPVTPESMGPTPMGTSPVDSLPGTVSPTLTPINDTPPVTVPGASANPIPNITPIVNENVTVTPVSESGSPTPTIEPISPISQVPPVEANPIPETPSPISPIGLNTTPIAGVPNNEPNSVQTPSLDPISPISEPIPSPIPSIDTNPAPIAATPNNEPSSVQTPSLEPISPISEPTPTVSPVNEGPITPVMPAQSVETPNPSPAVPEPAMELPSIPEPTVAPEPVAPTPTGAPTNNVTNAVNQVRDLINNLENNGYIVDIQELDLPDKYQLTISIKK